MKWYWAKQYFCSRDLSTLHVCSKYLAPTVATSQIICMPRVCCLSAIARTCDAKVDDKRGAGANNWKRSRPIRVVRNYKGAKHSKYAPKEGNRYDGLYKVQEHLIWNVVRCRYLWLPTANWFSTNFLFSVCVFDAEDVCCSQPLFFYFTSLYCNIFGDVANMSEDMFRKIEEGKYWRHVVLC